MLGALKGVMKNRGLGMNVKKVLYEKVAVPTVMYGSESWGMKVTERQKLNLFRQNTYLQNKKHMLTCQRWDWLL